MVSDSVRNTFRSSGLQSEYTHDKVVKKGTWGSAANLYRQSAFAIDDFILSVTVSFGACNKYAGCLLPVQVPWSSFVRTYTHTVTPIFYRGKQGLCSTCNDPALLLHPYSSISSKMLVGFGYSRPLSFVFQNVPNLISPTQSSSHNWYFIQNCLASVTIHEKFIDPRFYSPTVASLAASEQSVGARLFRAEATQSVQKSRLRRFSLQC